MQVYRIYNTINKKSYIGITKWTFKDRYPHGCWWKWTHNNHLKRAVIRYGLEKFEVEILSEPKTLEDLESLEKMYIEQYNSLIPYGYNLTKGGFNHLPTKYKEYELHDFKGNIYRISNLSDFCRKNNLNYGAMLNLVSGRSKSSQGFALIDTKINEIIIPNEEWILENIRTGNIEIVKRYEINTWSKKHCVKGRLIERVINGTVLVSQNWKLRETILPPNYRGADTKYKCSKFLSPDNKIVIIENIYKFCKDNHLERGGFYNLIKGKALEYKGWRLPVEEIEYQKRKASRFGRTIKLISPDNQTLEVKNICQFCREYQLNRSGFEGLIIGRSKNYKGWRIYHE